MEIVEYGDRLQLVAPLSGEEDESREESWKSCSVSPRGAEKPTGGGGAAVQVQGRGVRSVFISRLA